MFCVGLTGPIASGKSTVAALFAELGADLIDADLIAKQLTAKDQPVLQQIVDHFGLDFLDSSGHLQRRLLRNYVFSHPQERVWLEQLLHPLIRKEIETRLQVSPTWYYMIEIPLLLDKKHYPYLNRTLVILVEYDLQIQRAMQRDQHLAGQVQAIIEAQANENTYRKHADDIIINNGDMKALKQKVLELHQQYCQLSRMDFSNSVADKWN